MQHILFFCHWFEALCRLEKEKGMVVRFIIGHSVDELQEQALGEEEEKYEDILRLPVMV